MTLTDRIERLKEKGWKLEGNIISNINPLGNGGKYRMIDFKAGKISSTKEYTNYKSEESLREEQKKFKNDTLDMIFETILDSTDFERTKKLLLEYNKISGEDLEIPYISKIKCQLSITHKITKDMNTLEKVAYFSPNGSNVIECFLYIGQYPNNYQQTSPIRRTVYQLIQWKAEQQAERK